MTDVYVVPEFGGAQYGTKDNPFAASSSSEFDALMRRVHRELGDEYAVKLGGGVFQTVGTREWADSNIIEENPGFRLGRRATIDIEPDSTLRWDVDNVPDDRVDSIPLHLIISTEARFDGRLNLHTPEEIWALQPRGQAVRGGSIDLQFSRAVDRWRAKGQMLRIGAVALAGHEAAIERVRVRNYGAYRYEGFPLYIQGAYGMYDRNAIAQLDPLTHIFDAELPDEQCSHITDCEAVDYVELSDVGDQVTVRAVMGSIGERVPGEWIHTYRAYQYQTGNRTYATGTNAVQGHTAYGCLRGLIARNYSKGALVLVYGDFLKTRGLEVVDNEAVDAKWLARFLLSPTAEGMGNAADDFSHEDYLIARNRSATGGIAFDTLGPPTARRYIRNMKVEDNNCAFFENIGGENVMRRGNSFDAIVDGTSSKRGCRPW